MEKNLGKPEQTIQCQTIGHDKPEVYCQKCGEPIIFSFEQNGMIYSRYAPCKCKREESAKKKIDRLRKKGITDHKYFEMRFENDLGYNSELMKRAMQYADDIVLGIEKNGLLLTGDVGTGKTFIAACVANRIIDSGRLAIVTSVLALLQLGFDEYPVVMQDIKKADLVILDDIGAERATEFSQERAFDIIDTRLVAKKPMVITTNISPSQMAEAKSLKEKRIYDRILGSCYIVPVVGESIRKKERPGRLVW